MYKTSMKHLWMHEFPFRNVIFLAIECKMYPKIQQKLRCVTVWLHFKTDHALLPLWRKLGWILWRTISWWKASAPFPYKKKTELSFELSLSIFCLLTVYFNLEMQNSGLKTTAWWSRGSHFVENGYSSVWNMVKAGAHRKSRNPSNGASSPLISWVNPFPSRFINRTACFPRKVSYFRESRMSPWKKGSWMKSSSEARPSTIFLFYYTSIFTILQPLGSRCHEIKVNELPDWDWAWSDGTLRITERLSLRVFLFLPPYIPHLSMHLEKSRRLSVLWTIWNFSMISPEKFFLLLQFGLWWCFSMGKRLTLFATVSF